MADGTNLGKAHGSISLDLGPMRAALEGIRQPMRQIEQASEVMRVAIVRSQQQAAQAMERLKGSMALQQRQHALLSREVEQTATRFGVSSIQAQKKQLALDRLSQSITNTKARLEQATREVARFTDELNTSGSGTGSLVNRFGTLESGLGRIKGAMAAVGAAMAAFAAVVALVTGFGRVVTAAADFEQAMARVAAVSGASGEAFTRLTAVARELGAATTFSAVEAAEGMQYLAMAGFSVNEIVDAMPGLLDAAAAAQMDLGRAADIVSNIMTGFGLAASESGRAADVLVKAANSANTDLPQLGMAMKYVAPVAAALGLSLEDATAAIAKMSGAGIQGEMAGTALRGILIRLSAPTKEAAGLMERLGIRVFDAQGNIKAMPDVIAEFVRALDGMTSEQQLAALQTIVGTEAVAGFLELMNAGPAGIREFSQELENSAGAAAETAARQNDTFNGSLERMRSALSDLQIALGNVFLPTLRKTVDGLALVATWATNATEELAASGATIRDVLIPVLTGLGVALLAYALQQIPAFIAATTASSASLLAQARAFGVAAAAAVAHARAVGAGQAIVAGAAAANAAVTASLGATAAAALAIAAPLAVIAAAFGGAAAILQKINGLGAEGAAMWERHSAEMLQSAAVLTRYEGASTATQKVLKSHAERLRELRDAQREEMEARGQAAAMGDKDAAWWEASNQRSRERLALIESLTAELGGYVDASTEMTEAELRAAVAADTHADAMQRLRDSGEVTDAMLSDITTRLQALAERSDQGAAWATALARAYAQGTIGATQFALGLRYLEQVQQSLADAAEHKAEADEAAAQAARDAARAEAEKGAAALAAAGDIEGAIALLRSSAGLTEEAIAELEDRLDALYEAGRKAWNGMVDAETDYREETIGRSAAFARQREAAERAHQATIAKETAKHQTDQAERTRVYQQKRTEIERDYGQKRTELLLEQGEKRAELITRQMDELAELERAKVQALARAMREAMRDGTRSLGEGIASDASFVRGVEDRRAALTQRLAEMDRDQAEARADLERDYRDQVGQIEGKNAEKQRAQAAQQYARKHADLIAAHERDRQAAESAFAEQERQAALAYANEQARQAEHLGRMLMQYTMAQGVLQGVSTERIEAMTAALADEYGVQVTLAERSFGAMRDVIDEWATTGADRTDEYTERLGGLRREAAQSQIALDELIQDRTAQAQVDFNAGLIGMDTYLQRLQDIPKEARTELGLDLTGVSLDTSQVGQEQEALQNEIVATQEAHQAELLKLDADYDRKLRDLATTRQQALAKAAQTYRDETVAAEKAHQTKITDEIEAGYAERTRIADAAYAEQQRKADEAYAKEQARQRAEFGQRLMAYVREQGEAAGIDPAKIQEATDALAAEYGVQQSITDRMYAAVMSSADRWVARNGEGVDRLIGDQRRYRDDAVATNRVIDQSRTAMLAQAKVDLERGKLDWDGYIAKLGTIPTEAERIGRALRNAVPPRISTEIAVTGGKSFTGLSPAAAQAVASAGSGLGPSAFTPTNTILQNILTAVNRPAPAPSTTITMPITVTANGVDSPERVRTLTTQIRTETRRMIETLLGIGAEQVARKQR